MKTTIPLKRILITLLISFPLLYAISRCFSWHNRSNLIIATNFSEIGFLSAFAHIILTKIRRNFEIFLIMSILMLFLAIPSFWIVGMSYGWSDQRSLEYYVLWLFPFWMFAPSISELINCISLERQKP